MKFAATGLAIALALVTTSLAFAQGGDPEAGEKVYKKKCKTCHSVEAGDQGKYPKGPTLYGVIGRTAGTAEGYDGYSPAMQESGIVWDETTLSEYLVDPKDYVSGNKMLFAGLPDDEDRANLIAYLQSLTQ